MKSLIFFAIMAVTVGIFLFLIAFGSANITDADQQMAYYLMSVVILLIGALISLRFGRKAGILN